MEQNLKYTIYLGLFAVLFIPLVVTSSMFFPFITGKAFLFRFLVEIIFGLWVILAFLNEDYRPKLSKISASIVGLLIVLGISTLLSENPFKSFWSNFERMEGYITILHLVGYFLVLSSTFTNKIWDRFWQTSIGVSVLINIYALFQIFGYITINQGGVRVDATFGNATYLAVYALLHAFLAIKFLWRSDNVKTKVIYSTALALNLIILFFTATRGAILGFIFGLILSAVIVAIWGHREKALRKISLGILTAIIIFIGLFLSFKNTEFIRNQPVLARFANISLTEATVQSRFLIWDMAWQGFKERPVFGWGQESFNYVFNKYYKPEMHIQEPWFDRTHNIFLDWLIAGGLLSFLAYISLYIFAFRAIWKTNDFDFVEKSVLSGLLSAYIIHNIFVFDNIVSYILFFALLAEFHHKSSPKTLSTSDVSKDTVKNYIMPGVLIVMIFVIWTVNVTAYSANKNLLLGLNINDGTPVNDNIEFYKKALAKRSFAVGEAREHLSFNTPQLFSMLTNEEDRNNLFVFASNELKLQIEETPNDARQLFFVGTFFLNAGLIDESINYLEKAVSFSPKKQMMKIQLANAYMQKGSFDLAGSILDETISETPGPDIGMKEKAKILRLVVAINLLDREKENQLLDELGFESVVENDNILHAYVKANRNTEVLRILRERIVLNPTDVQNHFSLAAGLLLANQRTEAIGVLEDSGKLFPEYLEQIKYLVSEIRAGRNPVQ